MTKPNKSHLRWACRRGMLELDLILLPFFDQHFDQLSPDDQNLFADLLTHPDPDLLSWFMGYTQPNDEKLMRLIEFMRTCHYSI